MVIRRYTNDSSNAACDRCSRVIAVGDPIQGTKIGNGSWTDRRCFPDCGTALTLQTRTAGASRSAPLARPLPPKTVTFRVHSTKRLVECMECGKNFRVGDQMTAEVHNGVGAEKWQNKRCFPSCNGTKDTGDGGAGTSKMASTTPTTSTGGATRSVPVLTPGRRCHHCDRTLQAGESFLVLPAKVMCNPCIRSLINPMPSPTSATPSERKNPDSSHIASPRTTPSTAPAIFATPSTHTPPGGATLSAGLAGHVPAIAPTTPSKRNTPSTNPTPTSADAILSIHKTRTNLNQFAPLGPGRSSVSVAPAGWPVSTRTLNPTPNKKIVAMTAMLDMQLQNIVRTLAPTPTAMQAAAAVAAKGPSSLTSAGPTTSLGRVGSSTRPKGSASDTPHPFTPFPSVSRIQMNRVRPLVTTAAAKTTNWQATSRNRAVPPVPPMPVAPARKRASRSREDDEVECIGDIGIEEQIKRRMATSVVVNLADSEGLTSASSPSACASHRPAKKKTKLGEEKIKARRGGSGGGGGGSGGSGGSCRNDIVDLT